MFLFIPLNIWQTKIAIKRELGFTNILCDRAVFQKSRNRKIVFKKNFATFITWNIVIIIAVSYFVEYNIFNHRIFRLYFMKQIGHEREKISFNTFQSDYFIIIDWKINTFRAVEYLDVKSFKPFCNFEFIFVIMI